MSPDSTERHSAVGLQGVTDAATIGEAAAIYANAGFRVFPIVAGEKYPPRVKGWPTEATSDTDRISEWWDRHPSDNIGVATAGLLVVDLDVRPDSAVDGFEAWCDLVEEHADGWWPQTFTVRTPSAGLHLWLSDAGRRFKNTAGKLGTGIDTRATGGYIVAPPSRTDAGVYSVWHDRSIAVVPDWLASLLDPPRPPRQPARPARYTGVDGDRYAAAALANECELVAAAPVGTRNQTLNVAAYSLGTLVGAGRLDAREVAGALLEAAARCGLPQFEAIATISSGLKAGIDSPRREPAS